MCGIFGIVRLSEHAPPIDERALSRMRQALAHRGGDGEATFVDDTAALGLTRLAIVGVNEPARVFWDRDHRHVAVMNGEIYNHAELRRRCGDAIDASTGCDTAVLPVLLATRGLAFANDLIGEYAAAIYTPSERRLLLLRDRLGVKPLYMARAGDTLVFASEPRAIVASGLVPPGIAQEAAARALVQGYLAESESLARGINVVPPAHLVDIRDGGLAMQRYWSPYERAWGGDIDALAELTREVVATRSRSERPIVVALSGGLDSTLVATLARPSVATAFTLAVEGVDESAAAAATAQRLGLAHVTHRPTAPTLATLRRTMASLGSPEARLFGIATVLGQLAERIHSGGYRVAIGGEGADELFLGYPWHHLQAATQNLWPLRASPHDPRTIDLPRAHAALILRQGGLGRANDDWLRIFDGQGWERAERWALALTGAQAQANALPNRAGAAERQAASLTHDMLAGPVRIADRMWMQHAVELRTPYLDHRLVEAVASLDADLLESPDQDKPVLRAIAARLAPEVNAPQKRGLTAWPRPSKEEILSWSATTFASTTVAIDQAGVAKLMAEAHTDDVALHVLWHALVTEVAARPLTEADGDADV